MPAIREGSILVNTALLDFEDIMDLLMKLCDINTSLVYTVEPGYGVVVFPYSENVMAKYTTIPPHTMVFSRDLEGLTSDLCDSTEACMKLSRPAWIKTWSIEACMLSTTLNNLFDRKLPRIKLGEKTVIAVEEDIDCNSIYVVEGIYRYNYSWFTGRALFYDIEYNRILQKHLELRDNIIPLIYNGEKYIAYIDHSGLKLVVDTKCLYKLARLYFDVILDYIALLAL